MKAIQLGSRRYYAHVPRKLPRNPALVVALHAGAQTPEASLPGLRVYLATDDAPAAEVLPPPSPRKCWTRGKMCGWVR